MPVTFKEETARLGGLIYTIESDASGGTSVWCPVARDSVGIDLAVASGTARVEMTASSNADLANAVVTTVDIGTLAGPASASSTIAGASFVRLVATGASKLSVRT